MIFDIIIGILLVLALGRGYQLGLIRQVFSAIGFFLGVFVGIVVDSYLIHLVSNKNSRLVLTILLILGCAFIFLSIGEMVGAFIKKKMAAKIADKVDSGIGSLAGGVTLLFAVWLATAVLISLPVRGLQTGVRHSSVINALDKTLPPAPSVITKLSYLMDPNSSPLVFLGREPELRGRVTSPDISGQLREAVNKSAKSVVKVEGLGCGGLVEGSGFVAGQDLVATNAHVVAGISRPYVVDSTGHHDAKVIFFDPDLDFAVLEVDDLTGSALVISSTSAEAGVRGAVMGYPRGGNLHSGSAVVLNKFTATGRNIYNQSVTKRDVLGLQAKIVSGNSGGPLINSDGDVIGMIFAKSTTYQDVGYALTALKIKAELNQASASRTPASTGQCAG